MFRRHHGDDLWREFRVPRNSVSLAVVPCVSLSFKESWRLQIGIVYLSFSRLPVSLEEFLLLHSTSKNCVPIALAEKAVGGIEPAAQKNYQSK